MAKVRDYGKLASDILKEVGGEDNIVSVTHCATRLRLVLKETTEEAKNSVSKLPGVITAVENGGQFQIVIGTHVGEVYDNMTNLLNMDKIAGKGNEEEKKSVLNRIVVTMSGVFAPFIYILAAAGILQGILILINLAIPSFAQTGTYEVLSFMSWTPFTFLPIFIAITAAKHFKCNIYIAVLCCAALVNPTWAEIAGRIADGETIKFLFFNLTETTYTSSVLPPLFLVWILSYVEKFVEKSLPETIKSLFTPLICLVIMVPLTILLIGPVSTIGANAIASGYNALVDFAPALAGIVIGGFWQVIVIFGFHWGVTPMVMANFAEHGYDSFQAFQTIAVVAQMAAAFGVYLKTKNKESKSVALSAGITGIFGITEPAIYGINLPLKKPFICGCIGGAVGAVVTSFFHSAYYVYAGLPSLLTVVYAIGENPMSFIGEVIGCVVAVVVTIVLIFFVGFEGGKKKKGEEADSNCSPEKLENHSDNVQALEQVIYSPIKGKAMELSNIKDEVFRSGAMGLGAFITPEEGKVYAPFDGQVVMIFETKHAIGLKNNNGVELLIHVGMDTVELKGKHFKAYVIDGQKISKGDLLLEFDIEGIKKDGYEIDTPVIVTNFDDYHNVSLTKEGNINNGENLLRIQ